jgi:uncharacterized coiled-coil protein SlyX
MAATAEALLNTLAGGSDDGASASPDDSGPSGEQSGSGRPAEGSHDSSGKQLGRSADQGSDAGSDPRSATVPPDTRVSESGDNPQVSQVANLNAAIRETRSENKALKQQLQELTAKIEALSKPATKTEEPAEPDFLADPKGYVDAAKAKLKELTDKIEADKQQQTEAQKQQQQAQETWNKVLTTESEFAAATPDYYDAINHVRAVRAEQIKIEIREAEDREPTPEEVGRILSIQEYQGAAALIAKGKNPSKFYYEYAKTFGYKPKAATPPPAAKPDKEAVRTMGSGGAAEQSGGDEPTGALGILAQAQSEHKAQFKRRK